MTAVPALPEPATSGKAAVPIGERDLEVARLRQQLTQARQELEDTNRGLIALYTELQEARQAEARLAAVVLSSDDAIISMTNEGVIQTWNPGARRLLGHYGAEVVGQPVHALAHVESDSLLAASMERIRQGEEAQRYDTKWRRLDGGMVDLAVNVFALRDTNGALIGFSAIARDITAQVEAQQQLEHLARYDALTGLANRAETMTRLHTELERMGEAELKLGVLFCDIDRFKIINDTWGHAAGDAVLSDVARSVRGCVREYDTVGRLGGDELLVLLPKIESFDEATTIAEEIRRRCAMPIHYDSHTIAVTLSIGATVAVAGESVTELTARADIALYQAKRTGRNSVVRIE